MAAEVVEVWRDFMLDAPDEVGAGVALITAPPAEFVPEPARGQPAVGVVLCYAGDLEEGERVLRAAARVRSAGGRPGRSRCRTSRSSSCSTRPNPKGMHNYWSGDFLAELPDEAVDALRRAARSRRSRR